MNKILFTVIYLTVGIAVYAQQPKQAQTDVFILNSCSPTQVSFSRIADSIPKETSLNKLSINGNRLSAFKITNINPLRYSYNINNQFVSQFLGDNDAISGDIIKDTVSLLSDDIAALSIFTDTVSGDGKPQLTAIKQRIKSYHDSIQILKKPQYDLIQKTKAAITANIATYDNINDSIKATNGTTKSEEEIWNQVNKTLDSLANAINQQTENIKSALDTVGQVLGNLTINNNGSSIFEDILNLNNNQKDSFIITSIKPISANVALTRHQLNEIDTLLNQLTKALSTTNKNNKSVYYSRYSHTIQIANPETLKLIVLIDSVKKFASNKTFTYDKSKLDTSESATKLEELYKIMEFSINEKIKVAQAFVVFTSLEIGKLLQDKIVDCSRFQNQLKLKECINDSAEIKDQILKNRSLYFYIQDLCADLNVLINFLQLKDPAFNKTVQNINSNYKNLLKFIQILDFVQSNVTETFSLPASNNYRNVDLIRYTIERRDFVKKIVQPYTYDIWIKGGLKVDFSVAILLSQLNDISYNKTAMFDSTGRDSITGSYILNQRTDSFLIKKADNGKYNFAFGGMVNVMWRTGAAWVTPGASVGIAYGSATNSKLQFLGAISLQFGKTQRLIAHFGIVAGQIQQLDFSQLNYSLKQTKDQGNFYQVQGNFSTTPIPYNYKFVFKPFFGISYNLSKKNALNAVGNSADNFNNALPK